jgi:hypothetical protein
VCIANITNHIPLLHTLGGARITVMAENHTGLQILMYAVDMNMTVKDGTFSFE